MGRNAADGNGLIDMGSNSLLRCVHIDLGTVIWTIGVVTLAKQRNEKKDTMSVYLFVWFLPVVSS